jgi:hypothetical protein
MCMGYAHYIFVQNYDMIQNVYVRIDDQHFKINFKFSVCLCYCNLIDLCFVQYNFMRNFI